MARTIDQIRASKLPSNMMQFAARGALQVPAAENIEILVYLARHNKVFGEQARMTLAGMGRKGLPGGRRRSANRPRSSGLLHLARQFAAEVVACASGKSFGAEGQIIKLALSATRESIEVMLKSPRVRSLSGVLEA